MIGEIVGGAVAHLASSWLGRTVHQAYQASRLLPYGLVQPRKEIRVAFSALLRLEDRQRFLLVRNLHRPETFCPFGGVYKVSDGAREVLDELEFRAQVAGPRNDMNGDLRGFLPRSKLMRLVRWFERGNGRESFEQCLTRELKEELREAKASVVIQVPEEAQFRLVRRVWDGPVSVAGQEYRQLRLFEVFDLFRPSKRVKAFVSALFKAGRSANQNLITVTTDEIMRGRARSGEVIGSIASYLIGRRRHRPDDPMFSG